MLKIYFGDLEEAIYDTSNYFDVVYEDNWITTDFAKSVIKDIDSSEVLGTQCIQSPVLGQSPPTSIAGGTKTVLLMYNETENIFNASTCGDNCAKWILKIAEEKDITINLRHIMNFGFTRDEKVCQDILILNNNKKVTSLEDYVLSAVKYLGEMK